MNQQERAELFERIVGELPDDPYLTLRLLTTDVTIQWLPGDLYMPKTPIGLLLTHEEVEAFITGLRTFYERITPDEIERFNAPLRRDEIETPDAPGVVYIMTDGIRHKIGFTRTSVEKRRRHVEYQLRKVNQSISVTVVYSLAVDRPEELEGKLHRHFQRQRIEGEWFDLNADMLALVIAFAEANQ